MKQEMYENIYITKDAPLIIRDSTAAMHYNNVYLEEGAYIEIRIGERFIIENLQSADDIKGTITKKFVPYSSLLKGEKKMEWNGYDIIITSLSGVSGTRGDGGGQGGGVGERGKNGTSSEQEKRKTFDLQLKHIEKDVKVLSIGGQGGDGGNGGNGGNGWNGTSKEDAGTIGGNGGNGGNAGNASDAIQNVYVQWNPLDNHKVTVECQKARGGIKGKGGKAGKSGEFYKGLKQPMDGSDGQDGKDGKAGNYHQINKSTLKANSLINILPETLQNNDTINLDFADQVQARAFADKFGGEEYLSKNYPQFYRAYLKTVQAAKEGKLSREQSDGTCSPNLLVSAMDSMVKQNNRSNNMINDKNTMLEVGYTTRTHDASTSFCYVTEEIYIIQDDKSKTLLENCAYTYNDKEIEHTCITEPLDYAGLDGVVLQGISTREFITNDGYLGAQIKSTETILVNGMNSLIQNITIDKPKSNYNNNPLIFLYNRSASSGENKDYDYNENQVDYHSEDNTVNTLIGISGEVTFSSKAGVTALCGYSMKSDTDNRNLLVNNTGAAHYNYTPNELAGFFTPAASEEAPVRDTLTVKFDFPDDWKCRLDKNVYDSGAKSVNSDLLFSFYYKVEITDETTGAKGYYNIPITIKSKSNLQPNEKYYTSENQTNVYIPPINIRWGCFAADTLIKTPNHTHKKICELIAGDMVMTPMGEQPIIEIYHGMEKILVSIETINGCKTKVTKDHPILTKRGVIRAENLRSDDMIKVENGSYAAISKVYEIEYEEKQPVYNIEVQGGLVYADGFLSGEFGTQNDLTSIKSNPVFDEYGVMISMEEEEAVLSEETKGVIEEMKALLQEQFGLTN